MMRASFLAGALMGIALVFTSGDYVLRMAEKIAYQIVQYVR